MESDNEIMEDVENDVAEIDRQAREADEEEEREAKKRRISLLGPSQKVFKGDAQNWLQQMRQELNPMEATITELFSPPRVTKEAKSFNLKPGDTFDLTVVDPDDGLPWDMNDEKKKSKA